MGLFNRASAPEVQQETITEDTSRGPADIPSRLLVFPVRDNVLYPHTFLPVYTDDARVLRALNQANQSRQMVVGLTVKPEPEDRKQKTEDGSQKTENRKQKKGKSPQTPKTTQPPLTPQSFYSVGTAAIIQKILPFSRNTAMVIAQGVAKVSVLEFVTKEPPFEAVVAVMPELGVPGKRLEGLQKSLVASAQKLLAQSPSFPPELQAAIEGLDDPLKLSYLIATLLRIKVEERQKILETAPLAKKIAALIKILSRETEYLKIGGRLQDQVQEDFKKTQREFFLRQRLKAIRQELGEEDETVKEAQEYRVRLKKLKLPDEARAEVGHEIDRLEKQNPYSAEYQVIRTYLDWVMELPWGKLTKDYIQLPRVQKQLDLDHYGLKEPKERITEYLAVRKLKEDLRGPILCFVGPPGVGKTSVGQSIAKSLGRKFVRMSLGGMRDEAEIRGHRRTYIGALPGRIIQGIRRAGSLNPVFMLDEIDKVGADFRGDPSSALLEVLDPEQNKAFRDHYLDLDFDLSKVLFIATANVLEPIHPALRDRMETIELPGYIDEEKLKIAKKYLLPKQRKEHGLSTTQLKLTDAALKKMINEYTREAGVRNLERELAKTCRKIAKEIAEKGQTRIRVTQKSLEEYLGAQRFYPEVDLRTSQPGVVTGLAVTPSGGVIQFIEASMMPGKARFQLTGSMGEVMKESAQAALTLVRVRAKKLGVDEKFFEKSDLHLHVPAGAVPKDGPSAGIAMAIALASLLTKKPAKKEVAVTGEITLSGLVLPVGGIKEKVLAAKRSGLTEVILPKRNQADLTEIKKQDPELLKGLSFEFVQDIDQVLDKALIKA